MAGLRYLFTIVVFTLSNPAWSAALTEFGDFADFFGTIDYSSADPFDAGSFMLLGGPAGSPVIGIEKFDPALGTLTDIVVEIGSMPIFFGFGGVGGAEGGITIVEDPATLPPEAFGGDVAVFGEAGLYYTSLSAFDPIFTDPFDIASACGGAAGAGGCTAPIGTVDLTDGMVVGTTSIMGLVDPADFVGTGPVESLAVAMFIQSTADFVLVNAADPASFALKYDVFDGSSGTGDPVIGVTYIFTPVPLPAPLLLLGAGAVALLRLGRRG